MPTAPAGMPLAPVSTDEVWTVAPGTRGPEMPPRPVGVGDHPDRGGGAAPPSTGAPRCRGCRPPRTGTARRPSRRRARRGRGCPWWAVRPSGPGYSSSGARPPERTRPVAVPQAGPGQGRARPVGDPLDRRRGVGRVVALAADPDAQPGAPVAADQGGGTGVGAGVLHRQRHLRHGGGQGGLRVGSVVGGPAHQHGDPGPGEPAAVAREDDPSWCRRRARRRRGRRWSGRRGR